MDNLGQNPPAAEEIKDDVAPNVEGKDDVAPNVEGKDDVAPNVEGKGDVAPNVEGAGEVAPNVEGADGVDSNVGASTSGQNQIPGCAMETNGSAGSDMDSMPSTVYTTTDSDTESSMEPNENGKANGNSTKKINDGRPTPLNKLKEASSSSPGASQNVTGVSLPEWKKSGKDWRLKALLAGAQLHEVGMDEDGRPIGKTPSSVPLGEGDEPLAETPSSVTLDKSDALLDETPSNVTLDKGSEPLNETLQSVPLDATTMHLGKTGQISSLETLAKRAISSSELHTDDCSDITSKEQLSLEQDKHYASTEECHEQQDNKNLVAESKNVSETEQDTDVSQTDENIVTDEKHLDSATAGSSENPDDPLNVTQRSTKRSLIKTDAADTTESDAKRKKSD